jgi:hypothetical protein
MAQPHVDLNQSTVVQSQPKASLLHLPVELHRYIIEELPLSAHILYRTQICRTLRNLFDGELRLCKASRFDLVEWTQAERQIKGLLRRQKEWMQAQGQQGQSVFSAAAQIISGEGSKSSKSKSIWDTSPTSTPRPAPPPTKFLPTINHLSPLLIPETQQFQSANGCDSLIHGNHPEVAFFVRCMKLLGKIKHDASPAQPLPSRHEKNDDLVALSLLSRSGFKVASLVQLLDTQPSLQHVETILMTSASFIDAGECFK